MLFMYRTLIAVYLPKTPYRTTFALYQGRTSQVKLSLERYPLRELGSIF